MGILKISNASKVLRYANKKNNTITAAEFRKLNQTKKESKSKLCVPSGSITVEEYKEFMLNTQNKTEKIYDFKFNYELEITDYGFLVRLKGMNYSKNVINKWHWKVLRKYRKAIKEAMRVAAVKYKKILDQHKPIEVAEVTFIYYNRVSRDVINHAETRKLFEDTLTLSSEPYRQQGLGLIVDDKEENVGNPGHSQILQNEHMIEAQIRNILF